MTQKQIACLMCNIFLCTFGKHSYIWSNDPAMRALRFPTLSINILYSTRNKFMTEKLKGFLNYFERIVYRYVLSKSAGESVSDSLGNVAPRSISFVRTSANSHLTNADKQKTFGQNDLVVCNDRSIEYFDGCVQIDFANKYIGGGILRSGAVQEEIMMVNRPEMVCALIFSSKLQHNEALHVIGAERFNRTFGYGSQDRGTFKWVGDFTDYTIADYYGRLKNSVTAIDALVMANRPANFKRQNIDREILKAVAGFKANRFQNSVFNVIATGFWGCGAFGGDKETKALIQLFACRLCDRQMVFTTFDDKEFAQRLKDIHDFISMSQVSVEQFYNVLIQIPPHTNSVFKFVYEQFQK